MQACMPTARPAALRYHKTSLDAPSLCLPLLHCHCSRSGLMGGYLELCEAAGRLSTLHDEEFIVMLRMLAQMGAVSWRLARSEEVTCFLVQYSGDSWRRLCFTACGCMAMFWRKGRLETRQT